MKLAIIGSRSFNDVELLTKVLEPYKSIVSCVVSGGAKGADALAEAWAKSNSIQILIHKPDWKKYGNFAGPKRNELIISDCDECVAFWDGKSKGAANSIFICEKLGKKVTIITYDN